MQLREIVSLKNDEKTIHHAIQEYLNITIVFFFGGDEN